MFIMLKVWFFILLIGFVSGLDADLHCPNNIFEGEEFQCDVDVSGGSGIYDLKVMADSERNSVLRIFDGEDWKSGYYYVKNFVRDDEVVKLKILTAGRYDVVMKLRQGGAVKKFDVGSIFVKSEPAGINTSQDDKNIIIKDSDLTNNKNSGANLISLGEENKVISLGGNIVADNSAKSEKWDYVSKDGRTVNMLPYWFCLFLICLVGVLIWSR